MKDLFDMFSGTSTGSILSAGLSLGTPDNSTHPRYWANDIRNIYIDNASTIFKKNYLHSFYNFLIYLIYFFVFGSIFYSMGYYRYDNPKIYKAQKEMLEFLQDARDKIRDDKKEEHKLMKMKSKMIVEKIQAKKSVFIEEEKSLDTGVFDEIIEEVDREMTTYINSKVKQKIKTIYRKVSNKVNESDMEDSEKLPMIEVDDVEKSERNEQKIVSFSESCFVDNEEFENNFDHQLLKVKEGTIDRARKLTKAEKI